MIPLPGRRESANGAGGYQDDQDDTSQPGFEPGDWDGKRLSEARILQFCDRVMAEGNAEQEAMFA